MPNGISGWPSWLSGALLALGWMGIGLAGHGLCQRWWRLRRSTLPARRLGLGLLASVAAVNALLLALVTASAIDAFGHAEHAVRREAAAVSALGRSLGVLASPESRLARERLKAYARAVVQKEWPAMRGGEQSLATWDAFDVLFRALGDIQPATPAERALMPEVWRRIDELLRFRQTRLEMGRIGLPATVRTSIAAGAVLSLACLCVLPPTRFHRAAVALVSLAAGLVLALVTALDPPFGGGESVGPAPFEAALRGMERWDAKVGRSGG